MSKDSSVFVQPVKNKNGVLQFYSPSGEKVRIKYIWTEQRDGLIEHEKIDIVKEMNERAKGTSIVEQIARLERGDTSVIDQSRITTEDFSTDVSGMPEAGIDVYDQVVKARASIMALKDQEERALKEAEELEALKKEIIAKKAAYDEAVKAFDAKKSLKDGE